ncbi:hypothetical protein JZ751_029580 [Albula glossodonta]|uniref:Uncharacterized protein n=1 Tax=Albula glossodonta TaxID=121402 RepID=A0A8T2MQB4_9TELE|nr:hypothetical protein JZ751_029580 [Albula glossodonta]
MVYRRQEILRFLLDRGKGLGGKLFKSVESGRIQSAAPVTVIQNEPKPQSRDTHGDAGINRASGTKTRGTDFRLLLPQLEGRQWGDHEPIGAPSDSAKMLIPPLHPVSTDGTADLRPQPASYSLSGTRRRIIDTIEQVPWETRSMEVYRQQNVDPVTLRRRIHNLLRDSVVVNFHKSERLAKGPLERTSHVINPPG